VSVQRTPFHYRAARYSLTQPLASVVGGSCLVVAGSETACARSRPLPFADCPCGVKYSSTELVVELDSRDDPGELVLTSWPGLQEIAVRLGNSYRYI
jgi:hypothetical protein